MSGYREWVAEMLLPTSTRSRISPSGEVFWLIEAPSKEAAIAVYQEAHGLLADEVIEVTEGK